MAILKVLIVEDDPIVLMSAAAGLREAGLSVVEVESADEAAVLLAQGVAGIGVVFSDIETPGRLNGLDLVRAIKEKWPSLPVVLTSGRIQPTPRELPNDVHFIGKPYDIGTICTLVTALIPDADPLGKKETVDHPP